MPTVRLGTPLRHAPLSAPAEFCGTVEAAPTKALPRTLEQAFGPGHRSSVTVLHLPPEPMHWADRLVTYASACAGIAVVVILVAERFAS